MAKNPARIGILGGTFDPVHRGHIGSADELVARLALDVLHFVPCHIHAHQKMPGAAPNHRLAMLELALADYRHMVADDRELRRTGTSYTIDSLREMRSEHGANAIICFALGSDAFVDLCSWHQWQRLLELGNLVVIERAGQPLVKQLCDPPLQSLLDMSVEDITRPAGQVSVVELTPYDISSTALKERLFQFQASREALLTSDLGTYIPRAVLEYIVKNELY